MINTVSDGMDRAVDLWNAGQTVEEIVEAAERVRGANDVIACGMRAMAEAILGWIDDAECLVRLCTGLSRTEAMALVSNKLRKVETLSANCIYREAIRLHKCWSNATLAYRSQAARELVEYLDEHPLATGCLPWQRMDMARQEATQE